MRKTLSAATVFVLLLMFPMGGMAAVNSGEAAAPGSAIPLEDAPPVLDLVLKIQRLDETLNLVDNLYTMAKGDAAQSPTMLLRGMLQGTAWIDAARPIVIGVKLAEPQPLMAAIVPFQEPNPSFRNSFGAEAGPDYYIVPLPPGQPMAFSDEGIAAMKAAMGTPGETAISLEVAVRHLLIQQEAQIRGKLQQFQTLPNAQELTEAGLTPETLGQAIDTAKQMRTMTIGVDLNRQDIGLLFAAEAAPGTDLDGLFQKTDRTERLRGYAAGHQINFRSGRYDVEKMMGLFGTAFGDLYRKMGIDFDGMVAIASHFTGEAAGGMSFGETGIGFEMIAVMKDSAAKGNFLEEVYLPWIEQYGRDTQKMMEEQLGTELEPLYVRTADSQVDGYRVVGEKLQIPLPPGSEMPEGMPPMTYEMRMTMVGDLLLSAPDDKRIAELIRTTKRFKEQPSKSPLVEADIDLGAYIGAMMTMIPDPNLQVAAPPPATGKITTVADAANGKAYMRTSVPTADVVALAAYFAQMKSGVAPTERTRQVRMTAAGTPGPKPAAVPAPLDKTADPSYWTDKGALTATYGGDRLAIRFFEKAIALDPQRDDAYFQMGVSYGELREFDKALDAIETAIAIDPEKAVYYYGRGRVLLISGQPELAIEDFQVAAELGNEDAIEYIERAALEPIR